MGRVVKYLIILGVLTTGGLYGYSYMLTSTPSEMTQTVIIDVE